MDLTACSPCGPGSIPSHGGVFHGNFPWLIALCQPVLSSHDKKWLNLPSMTPHNLWTARKKAKVQIWTDNGWRRNYTYGISVVVSNSISRSSSNFMTSSVCITEGWENKTNFTRPTHQCLREHQWMRPTLLPVCRIIGQGLYWCAAVYIEKQVYDEKTCSLMKTPTTAKDDGLLVQWIMINCN